MDVLEERCSEKDEVLVDIQCWFIFVGYGVSVGLIFDYYTTMGIEISCGFVEGILEKTIEIDKESLSQAKEWIKEFHSESDQSD